MKSILNLPLLDGNDLQLWSVWSWPINFPLRSALLSGSSFFPMSTFTYFVCSRADFSKVIGIRIRFFFDFLEQYRFKIEFKFELAQVQNRAQIKKIKGGADILFQQFVMRLKPAFAAKLNKINEDHSQSVKMGKVLGLFFEITKLKNWWFKN